MNRRKTAVNLCIKGFPVEIIILLTWSFVRLQFLRRDGVSVLGATCTVHVCTCAFEIGSILPRAARRLNLRPQMYLHRRRSTYTRETKYPPCFSLFWGRTILARESSFDELRPSRNFGAWNKSSLKVTPNSMSIAGIFSIGSSHRTTTRRLHPVNICMCMHVCMYVCTHTHAHTHTHTHTYARTHTLEIILDSIALRRAELSSVRQTSFVRAIVTLLIERSRALRYAHGFERKGGSGFPTTRIRYVEKGWEFFVTAERRSGSAQRPQPLVAKAPPPSVADSRLFGFYCQKFLFFHNTIRDDNIYYWYICICVRVYDWECERMRRKNREKGRERERERERENENERRRKGERPERRKFYNDTVC